MTATIIARGKPAEYGQEIVKRRFRLAAAQVSFKNKIVLDFGCGNGAQTSEFLNSGCKILAIDITFGDLVVLRDFLRHRHIDHAIPVQYDGLDLPVVTGAIDLAVSFEVLEHVRDESQALREIYRVLKPHGEIVLSVPNKGWIFETHGAYLPWLLWNRVPFFSWLPPPLHQRFAKARIYRQRDIVRLLRAHSFEVLSTQYITAPMDVVKNPRIKRLLRASLFRRDSTPVTFLSTAILVHGRKI